MLLCLKKAMERTLEEEEGLKASSRDTYTVSLTTGYSLCDFV